MPVIALQPPERQICDHLLAGTGLNGRKLLLRHRLANDVSIRAYRLLMYPPFHYHLPLPHIKHMPSFFLE